VTRGWERSSDPQRERLFAALHAGNPDEEVAACILGKELLRESYAASTLPQAHWCLVRLYLHGPSL